MSDESTIEDTVTTDESADPTPAPTPTVPRKPEPTPPAPERREPIVSEPKTDQPREKYFTQAELDERIGKARNEGRTAAYRYLAKELDVPMTGVDGAVDLTNVRNLIEEARTRRAANESSLQDALARLADVEGRYSEKDSEVRGAIQRAQQMLRRGEAKATAIQIGFSDPNDAMALLGDLSRFEADLETQTVHGLEEALRAIATNKPYLLRTVDTAPPPPISGPTPPPVNPNSATLTDDDERRAAVREQARSFF